MGAKQQGKRGTRGANGEKRGPESQQELQKKAQADHEKLLAARKEKREALKTAGWHRSRDKTMASLKASMRALEEHHTALAARLAARDKVDPVVINDLKSQLSWRRRRSSKSRGFSASPAGRR